MFSVPSEMVNSLSAVRSSLAPRNSRLASSMMADEQHADDGNATDTEMWIS